MGLQTKGLTSKEAYNWNKNPVTNRAMAVLVDISIFVSFLHKSNPFQRNIKEGLYTGRIVTGYIFWFTSRWAYKPGG